MDQAGNEGGELGREGQGHSQGQISQTHNPHAPPPGQPFAAGGMPVMVPCPACRQMMPGRSRLCPHCGKMVDPATGAVLSGKADQIKASQAEIVYRALSILRIVAGVALLVTGFFLPVVGALLMITGAWFVLSGIGLLAEAEWVQMLVYWGSLLGCCAAIWGIFNALTFNSPAGLISNAVSFALNAATMWAISKISDMGA
ncbi:MAG: hypothetical protein JNM28_09280 [Armatimonadetes bacterium]|nr:hypothetical protein [Armatimonadota bacterium]MBS1710746.1 hypothetical protein [Armatimonadota bacterium]MBX3108417.1 hypothetical protein [Fimbriimonadaceae bacterium]